MNTHPPVQILGGDIFIHDIHLYDENDALIDISLHTFTVKMRTKREGDIIAAAVMTAAPATLGVVRITMTAAATTNLAASYDRGIYALRDDTLQLTLLTAEALIEKGVAS